MVQTLADGHDGKGVGQRQQSRPADDSDAATPKELRSEDVMDGPASKKRKLAAASARGVANLTPEQLAKKRANGLYQDREAQRAIRERTKNQIQTLERRIEELTSLQPYQELQSVIEAKEAVEKENAEIRQRLATIVGMLQPLIGGSQLPDGVIVSTEQPPALPPPPAPPKNNSSGSNQATAEPADRQTLSPTGPTTTGGSTPTHSVDGFNSNGHAAQRRSDLDQQREQLRHGLDMGPERLGLGFLLDASQRVSRIQGDVHGALDTPSYHHHHHHHHHHDGRQKSVGAGSIHSAYGGGGGDDAHSRSGSQGSRQTPSWAPGLPHTYSSGTFPSGYPYQGPHATADGDDASHSDEPIDTGGPATVPRFAAPVRTTAPTCPLDTLLLDFLGERRQRTAEGRPVHEVIGPRYPSVSSLLNPSHSVYSHPLSRVFTDILAKFPDISGLPERVAVLYVMFLLMRWQVSPTRENYDRLPPWVRPLRVQLLTPHPAWLDHLPFPRMREVLVHALANPATAGEYPFDNFFIPYTTTLTLSWPYHDTDTLLQSPHSEELMINPVFERHLRNLDNWKLGEAFARAFPGLADTCNVPPEQLAAARAATTAARGGYAHSSGM
ncbi:hypothetical protein PWT90_08034 [Aphanocladium album]|nr:hypothetical protein PWT90_08034 [Aphanocladium album]